MLTLRPGSQAGRLAEMLSVTGEFPLRSLHLLGSERSFRDLVRRLSVCSSSVEAAILNLSDFIKVRFLCWIGFIRKRTGTIWMRSGVTTFQETLRIETATTGWRK